MLKKFLSSIGIGNIQVDTVVDYQNFQLSETVSGTIYIEGGSTEQEIAYIKLEVFKRKVGAREDSDFDVTDLCISKHSIEIVGAVKSKETRMIPFEIVPDERWLTDEAESLLLRTTVHIDNAVDAFDEDEIIIESI